MKKKTWIIIGAVGILAVIAGFVFLRSRSAANANTQYETEKAERGTLSATIGATGTVHSRQYATLVWQTNGTVGSVAAKIGDTVAADQVLASLTKSSLPQNLILAEADLVAAQRSLDNLMQSDTPSAQAQSALAMAQKVFEDAETKANNMVAKRATSETIDYYQAQYDLSLVAVDQAEALYNRYKGLPDDNRKKAEAYSALYAAWKARDRALATLNWYKGNATETDLAQVEANLALAKAQLEDAQREWDRLKNGPDAQDILAAQARITAIQASLNYAHILAPFTGTVTVADPLIGDQVVAGMQAFRIDDLSTLLVDVQVSEVDINNVRPGQEVTLTFDAIMNMEYHGTVIEVSLVGNTLQGSVNFVVTVELLDGDELVKPGMTAAVTILVSEKVDVLLVPNRAVRVVDGQRVVYILKNDVLTMVEITLGATSDSYSEVIAGDLKEGDLIILNPPSMLMMQGMGGGGPFGG